MKAGAFEQLATDAGMDIRRGPRGYGVAFGVVLRTPTQQALEADLAVLLRLEVV